MMRLRIAIISGLAATACGGAETDLSLPELGALLFEDVNLSRNRTQACATCHDPAFGFVDPRRDASGRLRPVSLGDDGVSLGARNAPTVSYAVFSPDFHVGTRVRPNKHDQLRRYDGEMGGQFYDGRAEDLAAQAGGPPLDPAEMGMPSEAAVVARLAEDPTYVAAFEVYFGEGILDDPSEGYRAMTEAIAAFEATEMVSPFDSPYDRFLTGEPTLGFMALTGRSLFFSEFANCGACHQLHGNGDPINRARETFTGYEYHNLGLSAGDQPDPGIGDGRFKTPTLRNVAVTGPYMHDGRFQRLDTVLEFYEHAHDRTRRPNNPETGRPWGPPEFPSTVARELELGRALSDQELDALECFLRSLTDARYLPLLPDDGLCD